MSEKDYYEILGIRPNASQDEIDLAYRGRRSQYHPDRYANADGETLAWATDKMKEVNEAHAVLKDQVERAKLDQQRKSRSSKPTASPPPASKPERPQSLLEILQAYEPDTEFYQKIHVAPNIPSKKLNGAIYSYGSGLGPKDIIALIDDTAFGGAKEGVLITAREIRFKAIFAAPSIILLEKIEQIECARNRININGRNVAKLNVPDEDETLGFFDLINDYCKQRNSSTSHSSRKARGNSSTKPDMNGQSLHLVEKGYYKNLEQSIDRRIRASQGVEQATLQLIRLLLPISLSLEEWRSDNEELPFDQKGFLASDAIRFELLTYSLAVIEHLISESGGPAQKHANEIAAATATVMLVECVTVISGFSERRGLHKMADLREKMAQSGFFHEFMRRWSRYKFLIAEKDDSGLIREFYHSMKQPALLSAYPVETLGNQFWGFMQETIREILPEDEIPDFLDSVNDDIEEALSEWME